MSDQTAPADRLAAAAKAASKGGLPPVHLWDPPFCGDLDIRIAADGQWYYLGSPIGRAALVTLFASILKREGEKYFLVTPVEKIGITVEDAPLFATDFTASGAGEAQILRFTTRTEDVVIAGPENPLRFDRDASGETLPYVHVRAGLWAKIDRKSFFRLVDLACHHAHEGDSWFGLWSKGQFFPMIPSSDLGI